MSTLRTSTESSIEPVSDVASIKNDMPAASGPALDDKSGTEDVVEPDPVDESVYVKGHPVIRNGKLIPPAVEGLR